MSHDIEFLTTVKRSHIIDAAKDYAYYNGDRNYGADNYDERNMHIIDNKVLDSYDDAYQWVLNYYEQYDRDVAVRYIDYEQKPPTKVMERLLERCNDIDSKLELEEHKRNTQAKAERVKAYKTKREQLMQQYNDAKKRNRRNNGEMWIILIDLH